MTSYSAIKVGGRLLQGCYSETGWASVSWWQAIVSICITCFPWVLLSSLVLGLPLPTFTLPILPHHTEGGRKAVEVLNCHDMVSTKAYINGFYALQVLCWQNFITKLPILQYKKLENSAIKLYFADCHNFPSWPWYNHCTYSIFLILRKFRGSSLEDRKLYNHVTTAIIQT